HRGRREDRAVGHHRAADPRRGEGQGVLQGHHDRGVEVIWRPAGVSRLVVFREGEAPAEPPATRTAHQEVRPPKTRAHAGRSPECHISRPATAALIRVVRKPTNRAFIPSLARSCRRPGAIDPIPPSWMPIDAKLANPVRAYTARSCDRLERMVKSGFFVRVM